MWCWMVKLNKQVAHISGKAKASTSSVERVWDVAIFFGFVLCSALAIVALAVAAPVVLMASALLGLTSRTADGAAWRPAKA